MSTLQKTGNNNNKRKDSPSSLETSNIEEKKPAAKKVATIDGKENVATPKEATLTTTAPSPSVWETHQRKVQEQLKAAGSEYSLMYLDPTTNDKHSILMQVPHCQRKLNEWRGDRVAYLINISENQGRPGVEQMSKEAIYEELQKYTSTGTFRSVDVLDDDKRQELYSSLTKHDIDQYYKVLLVRASIVQGKKSKIINEMKTKKKALYVHSDGSEVDESERSKYLLRQLLNGIQLCHGALGTLKEQHAAASQPSSIAVKEPQPKEPTGGRPKGGAPSFPSVGCTTTIPNVAREALEHALAILLACDEMEEWPLLDNSDCRQVMKRMSKLFKDLLWFHDTELGFHDDFSREALMQHLDYLNTEWSDIGEWWKEDDNADLALNYINKANRNGMGRSLEPPKPKVAKLPPSIKPPQVLVEGKDPSKMQKILTYLTGINDKLALRTKTHVQLTIFNPDDKDDVYCDVVVSGAMDLRKLGQLVAYLTGYTNEYEIDLNRGKRYPGSFFELAAWGGAARVVLGDGNKGLTSLWKRAGISSIHERSVKIVQIFQGLVTSDTSGMVWDSQEAASINKYCDSLVWYPGLKEHDKYEKQKKKSNSNSTAAKPPQYYIRVEGILANKSVRDKWPLPRVVSDECFGRDSMEINVHLRGNRQGGPSFIVGVGTSQREVNMMAANRTLDRICDENGHVHNIPRWGRYFSLENVASAGLPTPPAEIVDSSTQAVTDEKQVSLPNTTV